MRLPHDRRIATSRILLRSVCRALVLMITLPALDAYAVTLRQNVIVQNDQIVMGDLFDGLDNTIMPQRVSVAPAPGRRIIFDPRMLDQIARAHNLDWHPTSTLDAVTVERAAQTIGAEQIIARLQQDIARKYDGYDKVTIVLDNPGQNVMLPTTVPASFSISNLTVDPTSRRMNAILTAPAEGTPIVQTSIAGRAVPLRDVPVLAEGHRSGQMIRREDLVMLPTPVDRIGTEVLTNPDDMVGKIVKRGINARALIKNQDVQLPMLVKRGEMVNVSMKQGVMALSMRARALEDGARGDTVRVQNQTTKKTIDVIITGSGEAMMDAPSSLTSGSLSHEGGQ